METIQRKKPLLSISLLSSGRKETIWKCLDSLTPIREAIDSELIIVDTGCDEETHNRMLTYTHQVIRFTWCNDFSKARNAGLKLARGEWFLFIDDDEWFTDVTEMLDFFNSGEYREYGAANYIQRNYKNKREKVYTDAWVSRMIRLDKDTRFVSSIHEYLYPVRGRIKLLHCPADHYGYCFDSDRERYAHSKRNVSLLLDMLEKEPDNLRWWTQLAQEYMGIHEYRKLEELCEEGIKRFAENNHVSTNRGRGTFYAGLIIVDMHRKDYERACERYLMAIKDERNTKVCQARLYSFGADIYYNLKQYEECEDCCKRYLEIYNELHENEFETMVQSSFFIGRAFEEEVLNNIYGFYIAGSLKRGDSSILKEYFYCFDWTQPRLSLYVSTPADIVEGMAGLPYEEVFVEMASTMMKRRGVDKKVVERIRRLEKEGQENGEEQLRFERLCNIFSRIENPDNYYIWYMKIRQADFMGEPGKLEEAYEKLFGRVINLWQLEDVVFSIALKYQVKLEPVFLTIKFDYWKKGVDIFFEKATEEKLQLRKKILDELCPGDNIRFSYFYLKLSEKKLCGPKEEISYKELHQQLEDFCRRHMAFYGYYYKDSAFTGEMELLPAPCRLAARLTKVLEEERKDNIKEMKEALKACFKVYPVLDKALQQFAALYGREKKKELKEQEKAEREMQSLAAQVKDKLESLLEQRLYGEAYAVWKQLVCLVPQDEELLALEGKIKEGLS